MQVYCAMSAVPAKRERSESKDAVAGLCGDLRRKSFPFQEQGRGRKVECKVCKQHVATYASAKDQHDKYSLKHIACLEWEKGVSRGTPVCCRLRRLWKNVGMTRFAIRTRQPAITATRVAVVAQRRGGARRRHAEALRDLPDRVPPRVPPSEPGLHHAWHDPRDAQ